MPLDKGYWFPAKRRGWGWTWPCRWQGWTALGIYVGLVLLSVPAFPPKEGLLPFVLFNCVLTALFSGLCWWKGERPSP